MAASTSIRSGSGSACCIGCDGGCVFGRRRLRSLLDASMTGTSPETRTQGRDAMDDEAAATKTKGCSIAYHGNYRKTCSYGYCHIPCCSPRAHVVAPHMSLMGSTVRTCQSNSRDTKCPYSAQAVPIQCPYSAHWKNTQCPYLHFLKKGRW